MTCTDNRLVPTGEFQDYVLALADAAEEDDTDRADELIDFVVSAYDRLLGAYLSGGDVGSGDADDVFAPLCVRRVTVVSGFNI